MLKGSPLPGRAGVLIIRRLLTDPMKPIALILAIAFLTGCAAPPPVKIASKLLGRSLLKNAKNETQTSDTVQSADPQ